MAPALKISAVQLLGLAALGVAAGAWLKRRLPLLDRLNIPTPIGGGCCTRWRHWCCDTGA